MALTLRPSLLKWPLALLALAGLVAAAYTVNDWRRRAAEAEGEEAAAPKRAANGVIKLGAELAESHGITDEPARPLLWYPRVPAYGRVVPNPRASAEVRAPFAGTLRADRHNPWPAPGRAVKAGQVLGRVDIRVGPQERLDLQTKLAEARARQRGAEDVLKLQQERADRLRKASGGEVVSRRELDEALVALAEARAQAAGAQATADLWQRAAEALRRQGDRPDAAWSELLTAPADGEVTELAGHPGMTVEAGGLIARVVDFCRPLVRLDVPPEVLAAGSPPAEVELDAASAAPPDPGAGPMNQVEAAPATYALVATLVGAAEKVDMASQFAGYWYEVDAPPAASDTSPKRERRDIDTSPKRQRGMPTCWRPGLFVRAELKASGGKGQEAVAVPRPAVLFHQGRALVYVRVGPGRYERREVRLLGREGEHWVVAAGVTAGEPVVSRQAQVLLSEEFRGDVDND
jgi:multidrug efflux pump subunit AcrA (membrane-fusion protein)